MDLRLTRTRESLAVVLRAWLTAVLLTNLTAAQSANAAGKVEVKPEPLQTDDFYWLVGKWDIFASEFTAAGSEYPMASFRVYKPYAQPEDLDITNVTNRYIAAEFLRGRPGGRLSVADDLMALRITTNELIVGTLPLPPPVLKYRHYRTGTNEFLEVKHMLGSWTFKKTSDYAGRPQVPWTFPYQGQEAAELERRYQQLRQKIRDSKR
jgi:hypothetical protein